MFRIITSIFFREKNYLKSEIIYLAKTYLMRAEYFGECAGTNIARFGGKNAKAKVKNLRKLGDKGSRGTNSDL